MNQVYMLLVLVGVACLAGTVCTAQDVAFQVKGMMAPVDISFISDLDKSEQRYVEILPNEFKKKEKHDLLICLHGHGSDRWQIASNRDETRAICDIAAKQKAILISPDYRASKSWMGPSAEADLAQIIKEQKKKRKIRKIILSGGSMGGTSVLIFTALNSKLVDGVCSMNGAANMVEYGNFLSNIAKSYGGTKKQKPDEYRKRSAEFFPKHFKNIPVSFTAGGNDTIVPPDSVKRLAGQLKKMRSDYVFMIFRKTGGHSTSYEDAMKALAFVFEKSSKTKKKKK